MHAHDDWLICSRVAEALAELDEVLLAAVSTADEGTRQVATHLISRGGKRLRPALLLLAGEFGKSQPKGLLQAAAALELIHVASLYHDDVMDRAKTRRGAATANSVWGNRLATVGGTLLFAHACTLLATLGETANRMAGEASVELCTGQLHEVENAFNCDLTLVEHLEILKSKTATLFELPCRLGAHLAGAMSAGTASLIEYARRVGLAFQLTDDALDLSGNLQRLGKATLTDIREGIYSFPIIFVLQASGTPGAHLRSLLRQRYLTELDVQEVIRIIQDSGAVAAALKRAHELAEEAQACLVHLPVGTARGSLERLAVFSVSRSH